MHLSVTIKYETSAYNFYIKNGNIVTFVYRECQKLSTELLEKVIFNFLQHRQ